MKPEDLVNEAKEAVPEKPFAGLEPIKDAPLAPAHGIAAIALNMAMKYHDIQMVKEGALYQQYKLEGKNLRPLHLDEVFETATKIEMFLLGSSNRIAKMIVEALEFGAEEKREEELK